MMKKVSKLLLLITCCVTLNANTLDSNKALVTLAAEYINSAFEDVEKSTKAIGEQYLYMYKHNAKKNAHDASFYKSKAIHKDKTTEFTLTAESAHTSYFRYEESALSDTNVKALNTLETLSPVLQSAYSSFDYSWVYVTTADNILSIYPTLPLEEAVHNYLPTQQTFYTCADFKDKKVGWSKVYNDLVGAGMMITASYPIYDGERLLGVASRDVTLKELSSKVLNHLIVDKSYIAFIVDGEDKVIASSANAKASEYVMYKKMGVISSNIETTGFSVVLVNISNATK